MQIKNLFTPFIIESNEEQVEQLISGSQFRIERIVSTGQAMPPGEWYDQDDDEWVVLLSGAARLRIESETSEFELNPGDYCLIPATEWNGPTRMGKRSGWQCILLVNLQCRIREMC
jgi:cupin 2 domain-containing protein